MVSVVVASRGSPEVLAGCLASLQQQGVGYLAEIVVARPALHHELGGLPERFPSVRWVVAEAEADIAHLRRVGLAAAHGDIVVLTEDHRVVGPDWLGHRLEGTRLSDVFARNRGGDVPVEPDTLGFTRLT
jgi:hypothetical protein